TIVVSMQNGLDNGRTIARAVARSRIACGVTGHGAVNLGSGKIIHAGTGRTRIAPLNPAFGPIARRTAVLLRSATFDATATNDVNCIIWSKLVVNAAINPLTAVLNVPNGYLLSDPVAKKTMLEAADEAATVAKAKGVSLAFRNPRNEVETVCRATSENISSMLQDVRLHRKTEIEVINGAIVREARRMGVPVPVNSMLLRRVLAISQ
ncbi:MAG: 2-dehydropantoate 2-reductase, partial [bacterium]